MEDDIVVIEGTPLAGHLRDIGLYEDIVDKDVEEESPSVEGQPLWRKLFEFVVDTLFGSKSKLTRDCFQNLSVKEIIDSEVIDGMDLSPVLKERGFLPNISEGVVRRVFMKRAFQDVAVALIPSVLFGVWSKKSFTSKMIMVSPVVALMLSWVPVISASKEYIKLKKYLASTKKFGSLLKNASRMINENALINRGYMLTKNNAVSAWKLETKSLLNVSRLSEKSLPGLRIAVVDAVSRLAEAYSEELQLQRASRPLHYNLDHELLCLPPVEDINAVLGIGTGEMVPELHVIKKAIDVAILKEQEYVRRMLIQMITVDDGHYCIEVGPKLLDCLKNMILEMEMATLLNRTLYTNNQERHLKNPKPEEYPHGMLYSVCHSVRLHVEGAAKEAQLVEDALENADMELTLLRGSLSIPLSRINFHVESAKACLERATMIVNRSTNRKSSLNAVAVRNARGEDNDGNDVEDNHPLMTENIPKDEIFELTGEWGAPSDAEDEDECLGNMSMTERESSQLMMRELKSVLRIKAQDWEERESKLRGGVPSVAEAMPMEGIHDVDNKNSTSSSVVEGDLTGSSMTSWVIPSILESGNASGLVAAQLEDGDRFDPKLLGSIASAAVATAKLNLEMGRWKREEEEYFLSGEED